MEGGEETPKTKAKQQQNNWINYPLLGAKECALSAHRESS